MTRPLPVRIAALLFLVPVGSAGAQNTPRVPADSAFDRLVAEHVRARAAASPEWATSVGLHERDDQLTDRSAGARLRDSVRIAGERALLRRLDTARLDARRRIDWRLLDASLAGMLHDAGLRDWERRPGGYVPFNAIYDLAVGSHPDGPTRMRALVARLEGWPAAMATGRRQVSAARTPPLWVQLDLRSARGIERWLEGELPGIVARAEGDTLRFRAAQRRALHALRAYTAWMADTLAPSARGDWRFGHAAYDRRLREAKLLDTSADSLVALGWRVFHDTERELAALARTIDARRSWRQIADSSKTLHPARDSVFATYTAEARRARDFIVEQRLFALPAGERLEMVLTPPHLRATYAYGGYDAPAPFEPEQVGRFFVTPVEPDASPEEVESKLRGHNHGWITIVAVHEGYPGHHLQYARAAQQPNVVRKIYGSEVFGEGWGLYSEELMYRAGFFPTPLARLTQLRMRLWRAARVIIDPSIHTGQMSYDQAVAFFVDSVGLEKADAEAEVSRYTTWATQAPSYILGMLALEALRDDVRRREGAAFDPARFHDRLLGEGSLPPVLMNSAMGAR
ncbi:MAG TPA: DUF885 domain-containing protein [Gemmatimonadaceae bacterium]|nr:DUF885 domain-containing protein [Gemmatimonadaceae bacterium]